MDESRRKLIKAVPLAAMTGVAMMIGGNEVQAVEMRPNKRYIFKLKTVGMTQKELNAVHDRLAKRGFSDCLLVSSDVDIFELE